jgi:hypothetical protein
VRPPRSPARRAACPLADPERDIDTEASTGCISRRAGVTFRLVEGKIVEGVRMMDDSLDARWAKAAPAAV